MDLFAIARSFRRHKWATLPVIILTAIAVIYVVAAKPTTYASNADVLLENPPAAPSIGQIDVDPKVAKVNANNPLASLQNLVQVADVLSQMEASPAETKKLEQEGASPGYQVAPDSSLETPPVIDITGVGANSQEAIRSAQVIAGDIQQELYQLQVEQHVNKSYLITSVRCSKPTTVTSSSSSKIRSTVVVLVLGLILLLVTVSVSQSIEARRKASKTQRERSSSAESPSPERRLSVTANDRYRSDNASSMGHHAAQRPPMPVNDPQPRSSMNMRDTLRVQSDRYWE